MRTISTHNATFAPMVARTEQITRIENNAKKSGIKLSDNQWEVIDFVMDVNDYCIECRNARRMSQMMAKEFEIEGGMKYLYRLFPSGPVREIYELAELEHLADLVDRGYGTSY